MTDVTRILSAIDEGDTQAAERLLPLVYGELRKLATAKMAQERPGQTLQATALVHEAYVRLVDGNGASNWNSRGHFFQAAGEAMRRILIENARRKSRKKHGGEHQRVDLEDLDLACKMPAEDVLALDEALQRLTEADPVKANLVQLRFFAGLGIEDSAEMLGISAPTAKRYWRFARAWLHAEVAERDDQDTPE
jgi:RNA polymerase sigma factor (TIGR02999 family)